MTKTYCGLKGGLKLTARYLGSKEAYEKGAVDKKEKEAYLKKWAFVATSLSELYDSDGEAFHNKIGNGSTQEKEILKLTKLVIEDGGLFTTYGQHAAGVVISSDAVGESIPLMWNGNSGNIETQCQMAQAEAKGFLKMDFLILENLSIITDIIRKVYKDERYIDIQDPELREKLLTIPEVYQEIFCKGRTKGVFQMEGDGITKYIVGLQPTCFDDLVLLNAAYRPGPMQFLDEIVALKQYERGERSTPPERSITIQCTELQEILEPTYGCIIYQEQVMQVFQKLAGYSLGQADLVRRAMSKKHLEELEAERESFLHGDAKRNIEGVVTKVGMTEADGNVLFDKMTAFAEYAFNKSHAVAYALVAYLTAYLKWQFPLEFYTCSLNYIHAIADVIKFANEMPLFHLKLMAPNLLFSQNEFTNNGINTVYFGTRFIKSMSEMEYIKEDNLLDFIINNNITKKKIEPLIKTGFLDSICVIENREYIVSLLEEIYKALDSLDVARTKREELLLAIDEVTPYLSKTRYSIEEKVLLTKLILLKLLLLSG